MSDPSPDPLPEPFELRVELGKVREFARATGSRSVDHTSGEDAVIPPTFLMTAALWQSAASSAWPRGRDMRRVLHAEQEFTFPAGPPAVGTVLSAQARVENIVTKPGRRGGELTFITMLTEYRDPEGVVVAEARMTLVDTTRPAAVSA